MNCFLRTGYILVVDFFAFQLLAVWLCLSGSVCPTLPRPLFFLPPSSLTPLLFPSCLYLLLSPCSSLLPLCIPPYPSLSLPIPPLPYQLIPSPFLLALLCLSVSWFVTPFLVPLPLPSPSLPNLSPFLLALLCLSVSWSVSLSLSLPVCVCLLLTSICCAQCAESSSCHMRTHMRTLHAR